jgi:hypothetical protein
MVSWDFQVEILTPPTYRNRYLVLTNLQAQPAQSYPVLLITLYLYILKIIRKSCVINLLRYIFI